MTARINGLDMSWACSSPYSLHAVRFSLFAEAQGNGSIWVATDTDKGCAPGSMIAHSGCDQPPAYAFRRDAVILDD